MIGNKRKYEILVEAFKELNYGDKVTHEQIATKIEEKYPSQGYNYVISKTKKVLRQYGIVLESVHGEGYQIARPENIVDISLKDIKTGVNKITGARDMLEYTPTDNLTAEQLERHRNVYDRVNDMTARMKGYHAVVIESARYKNHPLSVDNVKTNESNRLKNHPLFTDNARTSA